MFQRVAHTTTVSVTHHVHTAPETATRFAQQGQPTASFLFLPWLRAFSYLNSSIHRAFPTQQPLLITISRFILLGVPRSIPGRGPN